MTVPNTGGWQTWQTVSRSVELAAGVQVMRLALDADGVTGNVGNLNWLRLTPTTTDPVPAPNDWGVKRVGQARPSTSRGRSPRRPRRPTRSSTTASGSPSRGLGPDSDRAGILRRGRQRGCLGQRLASPLRTRPGR